MCCFDVVYEAFDNNDCSYHKFKIYESELLIVFLQNYLDGFVKEWFNPLMLKSFS